MVDLKRNKGEDDKEKGVCRHGIMYSIMYRFEKFNIVISLLVFSLVQSIKCIYCLFDVFIFLVCVKTVQFHFLLVEKLSEISLP